MIEISTPVCMGRSAAPVRSFAPRGEALDMPGYSLEDVATACGFEGDDLARLIREFRESFPGTFRTIAAADGRQTVIGYSMAVLFLWSLSGWGVIDHETHEEVCASLSLGIIEEAKRLEPGKRGDFHMFIWEGGWIGAGSRETMIRLVERLVPVKAAPGVVSDMAS